MKWKRGKHGGLGENERRNKEGMKRQFFGRERNMTVGGCVKERDKSSEVISKSCQRRQ